MINLRKLRDIHNVIFPTLHAQTKINEEKLFSIVGVPDEDSNLAKLKSNSEELSIEPTLQICYL
jgi:hypothetical protein